MIQLFLSASVPDPRRDPAYHRTADLVAIRDAVRALTTVALPFSTLHWGGHPAITPLIRVVAESMCLAGRNRVRLYQSEFFPIEQRPQDNAAFEAVVATPSRGTRQASLAVMRRTMVTATHFAAGVFIGGMEGVEEEFELFREAQPQAVLLPVASTGAAARLIFNFAAERQLVEPHLWAPLQNDYAYASMFRRALKLPDRPPPGG